MNTKVAVAMLLLIVIASTAMLMESNEVYSHNNSNVQLKAFGNSTILYHNSTYIMGKMDGLYILLMFIIMDGIIQYLIVHQLLIHLFLIQLFLIK